MRGHNEKCDRKQGSSHVQNVALTRESSNTNDEYRKSVQGIELEKHRENAVRAESLEAIQKQQQSASPNINSGSPSA